MRFKLILSSVKAEITDRIVDAVKKAGEFHKPGTGIAFVVPIEQVVGLDSQMEKFKEDVRKSYF